MGLKKTILDNQFKLYTKDKKAKTRRTTTIIGVNDHLETIKKTSPKKDGKGGAERVKKNARIRIRDKSGDKSPNPRMKSN